MLKSITKFSVNYPVTVTMVIFATLLLGWISLDKLGIELFPNLNNPRLFIELKSGERPPEEMEDKFVDRVESIAIRQSGVVNVSSVSRVGVAQVEVEYSWEKDMDEAFLDLSKALTTVQQNDELDEMNITQNDPSADPVMLVAFKHTETSDLNELRKVAENHVRNELIRLEGIADVEIDGDADFEVLVETNNYLMESYDLDIATIRNKIESFNQNISGGSIVETGRRYIIRGLSEFNQLSDLENLIVKLDAPQLGQRNKRTPVYLHNVAKVSYHIKDMENRVQLNGEPCLGLSIYKEMRYNTVKAVDELRDALNDMQKSIPGFTFTIIEDQGKFVSGAITEVRDSAIGGIILAVFILLIFLRKIGPTFIVSAAIPISIVATFTLMYLTDLTLNIMTLGGLALGAGMLVDNAIVVLENIFRNHESGLNTSDAAVKGTSQVGGAIIASTLTTIVVFVPIVYLHGASGELFKEQAITVAFSLLCSLVVAILIIPMLYASIYAKKDVQSVITKKSIQIKGYGNVLNKIINNRTWVILGACLLMLGGYFMFQKVGSEFMPKTETREFYVDMQMPEGTDLDRTIGAVNTIESLIREISGEEVLTIYSEIGPTSGLTSGTSGIFEDQNMGTIKVKLTPDGVTPATSIMDAVTRHFDNNQFITVFCRQEETALQSILGTDESPLIVELSGEEMDVLESLSLDAKGIMEEINGVYNVRTSVEGGAPEVNIEIDRYRAGLMNLDVSSVINNITQKLQGVNAGQMDVKGELKDINIKLKDITLKELKALSIEVNNNQVLLTEIANLTIAKSPREILHNNQNRIVKITADLEKGYPIDKIAELLDTKLNEMDFPLEYKYFITGEEAMRKESMSNLSFALILSLIMVYMVLASQFENLIHPFTILLTVPLSVVGAIAIFFILGKSLNIMAVIGIIMLVGIAVNDSIILVDAINQLRKDGYKVRDAIIDAGQRRIRPIIMTTLTTILALFPLTLGFGESASLRSPMAWAVIGGLITSTMLTLVVIPCVYMALSQLNRANRELNNK